MVIPALLQDWAAASAEPQTRSPCCSMKIRLKILRAMQLTMMTKSPKYSLGTRGKPVGRAQKPPSQVLHQRQLNQVKKRQCVPQLCCNSLFHAFAFQAIVIATTNLTIVIWKMFPTPSWALLAVEIPLVLTIYYPPWGQV